MSDDTVIRAAEFGDGTKLRPLVQDFVVSFELEPDSYRASFQRLVNNESALVLVAESDGEVIGYLLGFVHDTFYANGPVAWIEEIMVHSDHRRTGIGGRLMESFEAWGQGKGAVLSGLATRRASQFYQAIGYEESATYYRRLF